MEGGEHDGKRLEHVVEYLDREPAGSDLLRGRGDRRSGGGPFQPRAVLVGAECDTRGDGPGFLEVAGYIQAALLGRTMGPPVRAVYQDRLESTVPRRISIRPCSPTRTILVFFADERRGIFRVAAGADVYSLSSAGKSALRDSHRLDRQGHHRNEALGSRARKARGYGRTWCYGIVIRPEVATETVRVEAVVLFVTVYVTPGNARPR
jgi:hypothetical protein